MARGKKAGIAAAADIAPAAAAQEAFPGLAAALDGAQRSVANHDKAVAALLRIYAQARTSEAAPAFQQELLAQYARALLVFKREQAVERVVEFFAKFVAAADKDENGSVTPSLLNTTLGFLLGACDAKDKAVRFRACQTVSKLLNALDEGAEVDDEMWELLQTTMLKRTTDKIPIVRVQAINALVRLQDPSDVDCPVINAFLQRMECDSSPDVRKAAVALVALSKATIAGVFARRRDIKDIVRRSVYESLQEKLDLRAMSIAQRAELLMDGLRDRTAMVRQACGNMLVKSWLNLMDNNPETLLEALDVATRPEVCQLVADCVLERLPEATLQVQDIASLSAVKAFWWRCFVHYHQSHGSTEKLEDLLPEVSKFAAALEGHIQSANADEAHFIVDQLLKLSALLDYTDEAGRRATAQVLRTALQQPAFVARHAEAAMDLLTVLYPDVAHRFQVIMEIVDLYCDAERPEKPAASASKGLSAGELRKFQVRLAGIRVDILSAQDRKEACVRDEDYAGAEQAKADIAALEAEQQRISVAMQPKEEEIEVEETPAELPQQPEAALACLTLVQKFMAGAKDLRKFGAMDMLVHQFILPGIQREDAVLRDMAIRCLGLCCMFDRSMAQTHVLLFLQALELDQEAIQVTALEVLVDFIVVFGLQTFAVTAAGEAEAAEDAANSTKATNTILPVLERFLDSENDQLRTTAVEGFAKLLLLRRISSVQILSRLLLLYFNVTTAEAVELRQCLAVFFPAFAFASRAHQEVLEQAFLPSLRAIVYAPSTSPLAQIKLQDFIDMVMYLTSAEQGSGAAGDLGVHDSLALMLANEVLSDPSNDCNRALCKALCQLDCAGLTASTRRALGFLTEQIVEALEDRHSAKSVEKLQQTLAEFKDEAGAEFDVAAIQQQTEAHMRAHVEDLKAREVEVPEQTTRTLRGGRKSSRRPTATVTKSRRRAEEEDDDDEEEEEEEDGEEEEEEEADADEDGEAEEEQQDDAAKTASEQPAVSIADQPADAGDEAEETPQEEPAKPQRSTRGRRAPVASKSTGRKASVTKATGPLRQVQANA